MQAGVSSQSMADDQNIIPGLIEGTIRHVSQLSTRQYFARFQLEWFGVGEGMPLVCHLAVLIVHTGTGCGRRGELTSADQRGREVSALNGFICIKSNRTLLYVIGGNH